MKTLIIGMGEVGQALATVLAQYNPVTFDFGSSLHNGYTGSILHICFPYSPAFEDYVLDYRARCRAEYLVVHSTVPVGTCAALGPNVIHSPIRGQHPNLAASLRTFPKMLGGPNASAVADYFRRAGMRVELYDKPETTELAKLNETEHYRKEIEHVQWIKSQCDKYGLSFHEVHTLPTMGYNAGYQALGRPDYTRPLLQPISGPIGGHCVLPNSKLLLP